MPYLCNDICHRLPHVKSLRWVKVKCKYRYCSQCGLYLKTGALLCECCKNKLQINYKDLVRHQRNTERWAQNYQRRKEEIKRRRMERYWIAKSINTLKSLSIDNGPVSVLQKIR